MKKLLISILCFITICGLILVKNQSSSAGNLSDKLIRFHVIANSDLDSDQKVKLKVRDAILKKFGPILEKSGSRDESLAIISDNVEEIEKVANEILKSEGKDYMAKAVLGNSTFPIKQYGSITLPAGEYTALRVVLGEGDGKNWWCVMFPPLCFIDVTKGLTTEGTDKELKKVLNDKEVQSITAFKQETQKVEVVSKVQGKSSGSKTAANKAVISTNSTKKSHTIQPSVEFRFKSIDMLRETFNKLVALF
jgi:stage II sporulation protein R